MDRRGFLQSMALTTAGMKYLSDGFAQSNDRKNQVEPINVTRILSPSISDTDTQGHTLVCQFEMESVTWKVYEDLRTRDGGFTFLSSEGGGCVLRKSAEATFAEADPPYLGLDMKDIGMSGPDLLADKLLQNGDPDPEQVRSAAPPLQSSEASRGRWGRLPWNTFVGTKECFDTMPVYPGGNTRTYHPIQYFPELNEKLAHQRMEGLVGGWMPSVRKVMPISDGAYYELIVFGDVEANDQFIVQTWHRTSQIENGKVVKTVYGYSYPAFPPAREDPAPEQFYRGLLLFAAYWQKNLIEFAPAQLPKNVWIDMSKHAFARDLVVRPGGIYPKYGAVDRDYYGSEYDGFQDTFTSATYANLEWGRFQMAQKIIHNYFSDFVDDKGMVNMRGPETAQFGLTLSLLARYYNYTGDASLLLKYKPKIEATAALLVDLHQKSLQLSTHNPGYGLIHGWDESDSCLGSKPMTWWQPYFANSAFAARGLKDISRAWIAIDTSNMESTAKEWSQQSKSLQDATIASITRNIRSDMNPPYIGPLPGTALTFRESMAQEHPSPQQWPHRAYAELLQADILTPKLANTVIDCMRAYGATTLGVVANVGRPNPRDRDILGFISYGYAQMLLRLDRIEEYLLFLYSHRYHDHTPGSWTAGEVADIAGGSAIFCMPAQHTIPLLVRWMLVLEDSDEDRLYIGKGLPRDWITSGEAIQMQQAPTRWGRVSFHMIAKLGTNRITSTVELAKSGSPKHLDVKMRLPREKKIHRVTVNGSATQLQGPHKDTVSIATQGHKYFEIIADYS